MSKRNSIAIKAITAGYDATPLWRTLIELPVPFLFYDLETFGRSPGSDRIAEFAGILTDERLDLLEQPYELRCIPPHDYLAHPAACLVNRISPQDARLTGVPEPQFAAYLAKLFTSVPNLTIIGFNSASFDDEFVRALFFRTMHDPYEWHWRNGNARLDLIAIIPTLFDFARDRLVWPRREDGRPDFRLEALVDANQAQGGTSHEALADTFALRNMCRILVDRAPEIWEQIPGVLNRNRKAVDLKPRLTRREPADLQRDTLVYSSTILKREDRSSTLICPVLVDPLVPTKWWVWDLAADLDALIDWAHESGGMTTLPKGLIGLNLRRSLSLLPAETKRLETLSSHGLDLAHCRRSLDRLARSQTSAVFAEIENRLKERARAFDEMEKDVENQLYAGFLPDSDRPRMDRIRVSVRERKWRDLRNLIKELEDPRLRELAWRLLARTAGTALTATERDRWRREVADRLDVAAFDQAWREERERRTGENGIATGDRRILAQLLDHRNAAVERFNLGDRFGTLSAQW